MSKLQPFYRTKDFLIFVVLSATVFGFCATVGGLPVSGVIATGFAYLVGGQWVYGFISKRTMVAPYSGAELIKGEHDDARFFLFFLGIFLMGIALTSVAGLFT